MLVFFTKLTVFWWLVTVIFLSNCVIFCNGITFSRSTGPYRASDEWAIGWVPLGTLGNSYTDFDLKNHINPQRSTCKPASSLLPVASNLRIFLPVPCSKNTINQIHVEWHVATKRLTFSIQKIFDEKTFDKKITALGFIGWKKIWICSYNIRISENSW